MKKYLPLILLGVGLLIVVGAFVFVKNSKNKTPQAEEEITKEIPADERPTVSLIPTADGHYLKLTISDIKVKKAASVDYLLLYNLEDGRSQGVPGTAQITGEDIVKDLLLGSESNGKFRYDEGVTGGTVTLTFRDGNKKLVGKITTQFTMTSPKKGVYEVIMDTFTQGTKTFSSSDN